ncbi:YhfC family intramembrane metalloprotease [Anaerosacchariphilus polymeriproducens]|uniref:DUF2324 domain-containing protein n=1 Tax=Anaerosacchariphilus polymeriproducens TaxID=1812858 RepID=A0A371AUT6_9FIRM|nr:YhfC family glutamic-type intramembrane protease [Anaerosacchariphilus polymeriproducens]RDU23335.1 DUF2324 domain-containing protein [Anaerosacchariphilus polymeriproducens]
MTNVNQVPMTSIIFMVVSAILCFLTPIVLMIVVRIKTKAKLMPTLVGAGIFIVFALILEQICHSIFLVIDSPLSRFVNNNVWIYALYAGLAAGIFEETGRYVAFKFLLKKHDKKINAITYGIGHGGIEMIILGGLSMLNALATSIMINSQGIEGILALVPESAKETTKTGLESLITSQSYLYLITFEERVAAVILHVSLSVLVFVAVKNSRNKFLFPLAIILHALIDIIAVFAQKGIISSILVMEVIIAVFVIAVAIYASKVYKKE